jgi:TatD DNase family protein
MYFDAHTHAHFAAFADDYREVIKRALDARVGMINVGTQRDTSKRGIEVAHEFENDPVYATVGLHPVHTEASFHDAKELGDNETAKGFTSRGETFDFEYYRELATDPKVVGIGECGLDYYRLGPDSKTKQAEVFIGQIEVAQAVGKPLMIHCRDAFSDLITILKEHRSKLKPDAGVIHFFTGTPENTRELLDLGFGFTFGGVVTFARDYDPSINIIPLDKILSETDAPYVTPAPYRGKRNEPAYVIEAVKKLAELKGIELAEMEAQIWANAQRIFDIS